MLNLYITSALRNEGKSYLTTGIAVTMQSLGYSTSVYKPVQTSGIEINGFMQSPDLTLIKSLDPYINTQFTYLYKSAFEPIVASEMNNETIDIEHIINDYKKISSMSECTIIDGDGGLMSPLTANVQNINLIKDLQIPLLFVVTPNKNAINTVLSSITIAKEKKLDIRGVVINNILKDTPKSLLTSMTRIIEEYSGVEILGLLPHSDNKVAAGELINSILNGVDIESIFGVKIEKLDFE